MSSVLNTLHALTHLILQQLLDINDNNLILLMRKLRKEVNIYASPTPLPGSQGVGMKVPTL